jgi:hypothetical protein
MGRRHSARGLCVVALALLCAAMLPTIARAETHTFVDTTILFPTANAGTHGPANVYPSTISVSGVSGTITKATVSVIGVGSSSPDDIDMAIVGPNGEQVMLMSDACGENPNELDTNSWTFDDSAPTFISNGGPCPQFEEASFKPTNYLGAAPEPDDLGPGGGPAPPYLNALSFFNGSSPNGAWRLFVTDDNAAGFFGFSVSGWALTLEVQPPPAASQPTGQRAEALKKCKTKKKKKARRKCRQKANLLPE